MAQFISSLQSQVVQKMASLELTEEEYVLLKLVNLFSLSESFVLLANLVNIQHILRIVMNPWLPFEPFVINTNISSFSSLKEDNLIVNLKKFSFESGKCWELSLLYR